MDIMCLLIALIKTALSQGNIQAILMHFQVPQKMTMFKFLHKNAV